MFLEALEKFGNGKSGSEWEQMAEYVGTRGAMEIKAHAHKYFLKLQAATQEKQKSGLTPRSPVEPPAWTMHQDTQFENALDQYPEGERLDPDTALHSATRLSCCCTDPVRLAGTAERWQTIATLIPGKTAADIEARCAERLTLNDAPVHPPPPVPVPVRSRMPSPAHSTAHALTLSRSLLSLSLSPSLSLSLSLHEI